MLDTIFFYGTLIPEEAPAQLRREVARLRSIGRATVRGRLYNAGSYPAAVLDAGGGSIIGELFHIEQDMLPAFDRYEQFIPDRPDASLFRRVTCTAMLNDGRSIDAWIYVFNRPTTGLPLIASGQWRRLREQPV